MCVPITQGQFLLQDLVIVSHFPDVSVQLRNNNMLK